jgi:hypothetical protein
MQLKFPLTEEMRLVTLGKRELLDNEDDVDDGEDDVGFDLAERLRLKRPEHAIKERQIRKKTQGNKNTFGLGFLFFKIFIFLL